MIKRIKAYISLSLIAASFSILMLGLTYNIGFPWEEFGVLFKWKNEATWTGVGFNGGNEEINWAKIRDDSGNVFLQLTYGIKPLEVFLYTIPPRLFGTNLFKHNFYRAVIFGLLLFILLLFVYKYTGSFLLCFISSIFLTTAPQIWYAVVAKGSLKINSLFFVAAALYFFQAYVDQPVDRKWNKNFFVPVLIVCFALLAIFLEQLGRYIFPIILFYLVITSPKKILKHWLLLTIFLFISIPIIGIFYKVLFNHSYNIFGLHSWGMRHYGVDPTNFKQCFGLFIKNYKNMILYLNPIIFLTIFPISLYVIFLKLKMVFFKKSYPISNVMLWNNYLYMLAWLIISLVIVFYIRGGWQYTILDNYQFDLSVILVPYVIVFALSLKIIKNLIKNYKLRNILIILIVFASFLFNVRELNRYIGGIGGYIVSWDNVRRFAEEKAGNQSETLLLVSDRTMLACFKPNLKVDQIENRYLFNANAFKKACRERGYTKKYETIFVVADNNDISAFEKDKEFKLLASLPCYNNSLYDKLKWLFKKPSPVRMYIYQYHFGKENG